MLKKNVNENRDRGVIDHDEDDQPRPQPQTIFNEICTAAPSRQGKLLRSLSHE